MKPFIKIIIWHTSPLPKGKEGDLLLIRDDSYDAICSWDLDCSWCDFNCSPVWEYKPNTTEHTAWAWWNKGHSK